MKNFNEIKTKNSLLGIFGQGLHATGNVILTSTFSLCVG